MSSDQSKSDMTSSEERPFALVTGGTSGIGFAIAKALAPRYDLALSYASNSARANESIEKLKSFFPEIQVHAFGIPLHKQADVAELYSSVTSCFNKEPAVLVNAAGRLRDGLFLTQDIGEHIELLEEHLLVPMMLCHKFVKGMYKNQFGRVINLSSISARRFKMGQVNYSSAKAGIEGFTKSLAREVAHRGITVNAVAPGLIRTPMTESIVSQVEADRKTLRSRIPAGFVGEPEDIGALVAFLCSPEARYITGQVIDACGGRSLVGD
jgi:3-oxoacyl-[acyl-carrier protein] reductase